MAPPHNFAWFANPLALWCLIDMLHRRQPNIVAAIAAPILAIGGLASFSIGSFFDSHGTDSASIMYYTTDAWMWSCAIPIFASILIYGLKLPQDVVAEKETIPAPDA